MTKAEHVFEKLAKKKNDKFNPKLLSYGITGGLVGSLVTAPASTISTMTKGKGGPTMGEAIKILNREAKELGGVSKASKAFNYVRRYYRGTLPKMLVMGPATGIAWAVANSLKNKYGS